VVRFQNAPVRSSEFVDVLQPQVSVCTGTAVVFTFSGTALAQSDDGTEKKQDLQQAMDAWGEAIAEKDKSAMNRMLADDFLNATADGRVLNKRQTVALFLNPRLSINLDERDDETIRIYDRNAIVTGRQVVTASMMDGGQRSRSRDITCWILGENGWQLSVYQATPVR
jgi:hypothetical protein